MFYTPAIDVWSLGITIIWMATRKDAIKECLYTPLEAMIRFVGYKQFRELYDKLHM